MTKRTNKKRLAKPRLLKSFKLRQRQAKKLLENPQQLEDHVAAIAEQSFQYLSQKASKSAPYPQKPRFVPPNPEACKIDFDNLVPPLQAKIETTVKQKEDLPETEIPVDIPTDNTVDKIYKVASQVNTAEDHGVKKVAKAPKKIKTNIKTKTKGSWLQSVTETVKNRLSQAKQVFETQEDSNKHPKLKTIKGDERAKRQKEREEKVQDVYKDRGETV